MTVEVLLIPSCGIEPMDQLSPKDTLLQLFRGLCLWETDDYHMILVTGGFSCSPFVQTKPASHIMRDWLISRGVHPDFILTEDKSVDTFESVKLGLRVLDDLEVPFNITVVTQRQQARRYWISFLLGYGVYVQLAQLDYKLPPTTAVEEWFSLAYHLLDPRGKGPLARGNRIYLNQLASSL